MSDWVGEIPFYLIIETPDERIGIDLDEYQWMKTHAAYMRIPGIWNLILKENNRTLFRIIVNPGDQPYYAARHIGIAGGGGGNEITAFGIGAKRADGHTDRLWILPDGTVTCGDDVEEFGTQILYAMGPRLP